MKVIYLKKQAKNARFNSLVLFTRPHEKPRKRKHSSNFFVSQHFFTWEWDQKSIYFHLQWEEESDFLHAVAAVWQYKLDKNFDLTFEENRSLLSSMAAKICLKMLMKSFKLVNHFPSTEFSIGDWQTSKLVYFTADFFRLQSNCKA